jgi:hypothetical protein
MYVLFLPSGCAGYPLFTREKDTLAAGVATGAGAWRDRRFSVCAAEQELSLYLAVDARSPTEGSSSSHGLGRRFHDLLTVGRSVSAGAD